LGQPTRLAALQLVWQEGELCLCEIMERLTITQSRASRHMAVLVKAGLVLDRRDAQWVRYRKNTKLQKEMAAIVRSTLAALPAISQPPVKGKEHARH
jgi:ArsR family transcriptional regulator